MKFSNERAFASAIVFQLFTGAWGQIKFTPVTGVRDGDIQQRYRLDDLAKTQSDVYQITVLAETRRQQLQSTDDTSYIKLSDIHGKGVPYQEPTSSAQDPTTGYCPHMTVIFLIWHRLYVALYEQLLYNIAQEIANEYTNPTDKARWQAAAKKVRQPYFDFASDHTQSRMPAEMTNELVQITYPKDDGTSGQMSIANPYRQYVFTQEIKREYGTTAATTLRQPDESLKESHNDIVNSTLAVDHVARKSAVYALFNLQTFTQFGTSAPSLDRTPSSWVSLESIHNQIHLIIGGIYGDMSRPDRAAKDPAFWLVHSMIDRLYAMWECVWQNYQMGASPVSGTFFEQADGNNVDNQDTPLHPWRMNQNGDYWTYKAVAAQAAGQKYVCSIFLFGYQYDSVPFRLATNSRGMRQFVLAAVNSEFGPGSNSQPSIGGATPGTGSTGISFPVQKREAETVRRQWILHLLFDTRQVNGSASVEVYFDKPGVNATMDQLPHISMQQDQLPHLSMQQDQLPHLSMQQDQSQDSISNFIGAVSSFRNPMQMKAMQDNNHSMVMTGAVYLSDALLSHGCPSLNPQDVVPFLKAKLNWMVKLGGVTPISIDKVPSLKVGISSADITYSNKPDALPSYGQFSTHYDVTENKPSGFTIKDQDLVDSVPAPPIGGPVFTPGKPSESFEMSGPTTTVHVTQTIVVCPTQPPCNVMPSYPQATPYDGKHY